MSFKTILLIPCYNESKRINGDLFVNFANQNAELIIYFLNDGSTDDTQQVLENIVKNNPAQLKIYHLEKNGGKAEAIRQGIINTLNLVENVDYIGFMDADLAAPLSEWNPIYNIAKNNELLIASGCRVDILGNIIVRSKMRHYISRIFATFYSTLLKLPNYDTQCGAKIFERNFALQLFKIPFESKWLFDIELFLRARKLLGIDVYKKKVKEIPLSEWREIAGSKVKITDFMKAPIEILKIKFKYNKNKYV